MAEPVLQEEEPAPFLAIQGLVTLFYFLPGYFAVAWGIMVNPRQRWLQDVAVILAGASLHVNDQIPLDLFVCGLLDNAVRSSHKKVWNDSMIVDN
jgi:hypothetical protein